MCPGLYTRRKAKDGNLSGKKDGRLQRIPQKGTLKDFGGVEEGL